MTKNEELANENSPLSKAFPDEPIFVVRAKDPLSFHLVRIWAGLAVNFHERDRIQEALRLAQQMQTWRQMNFHRFTSSNFTKGEKE